MSNNSKSLQETYAPKSICFGCGPANEKGLRIRSQATSESEAVVVDWLPEPHHQAFPGMLNGGIIGSLLDCHGNWTAAWHLMKKNGLKQPPCTVTAEYSIQLLRPTPSSTPISLHSKVLESTDKKAVVEAELTSEGQVCAKCSGTFVAVKPGHPAYHRWQG